jgi:secretion/DNA translocation related TadE-like protein
MASPRSHRCDRGAGTVLVLGIIAAVLTGAAMLAVLVRGQAVRQAARDAADLAALAGAQAIAVPDVVVLAPGVVPPAADACQRARAVARRNGADLSACTVEDGGVVRVVASRSTPWGEAAAEARAGPRP